MREFRKLARSEAELGRIVGAYGEPCRHYHDLRHVAELLTLSATHRNRLADRVAVDLAILYHDIVYDPSRRDNEEASAILARERLTALGFPAACIQKVARHIEATKHLEPLLPEVAATDTDLDHFLDFDLSILAAEPAAYDAYAAAIRREYSIHTEAQYRIGRAAVVRKLLAMPRIYRVPASRPYWERLARANLTRELEMVGP